MHVFIMQGAQNAGRHGHSISVMAAAVLSAIGGGAATRVLVYISKALPPLPQDAGWWARLFYSLVKNFSGLDPSASVVPPSPSAKS